MNNGNLMDVRLTMTNGGLSFISTSPRSENFCFFSTFKKAKTTLTSLFRDVDILQKLAQNKSILRVSKICISNIFDFVILADSNVPRRVLLTKYCQVTCEKNTSNGNKQAIDMHRIGNK